MGAAVIVEIPKAIEVKCASEEGAVSLLGHATGRKAPAFRRSWSVWLPGDDTPWLRGVLKIAADHRWVEADGLAFVDRQREGQRAGP